MRKIILLSALFFVVFSVIAPNQAASAKTNLIVKKKIIQASRVHPMYGWEFFISYNTNTGSVIGVSSPDVNVTGFTFSSATDTPTTITVNDFSISLEETTGPIDASGDYTIF